MAILNVEGLSLEIIYAAFDDGDLHYAISLQWNGQPILNPDLLKQEAFEPGHPPGWVSAVDGPICKLLPLLRRALEENKADYWENTDMSVILAVYPDDLFPFLPSHLIRIPRDNEDQKAREQTPPEPEQDFFELLVFVDAFNLKGMAYPSGIGAGIRLSPTRADLRAFYETLRSEFAIFYEKNKRSTLPLYYKQPGIPLPF